MAAAARAEDGMQLHGRAYLLAGTSRPSAMTVPWAVKLEAREVRCTSVTPVCASMARMRADPACWLTPVSRAVQLRLPVLATLSSTSSAARSGTWLLSTIPSSHPATSQVCIRQPQGHQLVRIGDGHRDCRRRGRVAAGAVRLPACRGAGGLGSGCRASDRADGGHRHALASSPRDGEKPRQGPGHGALLRRAADGLADRQGRHPAAGQGRAGDARRDRHRLGAVVRRDGTRPYLRRARAVPDLHQE